MSLQNSALHVLLKCCRSRTLWVPQRLFLTLQKINAILQTTVKRYGKLLVKNTATQIVVMHCKVRPETAEHIESICNISIRGFLWRKTILVHKITPTKIPSWIKKRQQIYLIQFNTFHANEFRSVYTQILLYDASSFIASSSHQPCYFK